MRAINADSTYNYFYNLQYPKANEKAYEFNTKNTDAYYKKIQGAKTLQKEINKYIDQGNTQDWSMNLIRRSLDDINGLV